MHPVEVQSQDDLYKKYLKKLKSLPLPQEDKNALGIDNDIKNLIDETNLEAFLAKLAHGSVRANMGTVMSLSKIIGKLLKIHFSNELAQ